MSKIEIATYLASLDYLMKAQAAAGNTVSQLLSAEYMKYWTLLKDKITEDNKG